MTKIEKNPLINKKIAKWLREHDQSAKAEPLMFIHKSDLEEYLELPHYYFSKSSPNKYSKPSDIYIKNKGQENWEKR